jgi:hypothetical protein
VAGVTPLGVSNEDKTMIKTRLTGSVLGLLMAVGALGGVGLAGCDDESAGSADARPKDTAGDVTADGSGGSTGGSGGATGGSGGSGGATGGSGGSGGSGGTAADAGADRADTTPDAPASIDAAVDAPAPDMAVTADAAPDAPVTADAAADAPPQVSCESACPALVTAAEACEAEGACTFSTMTTGANVSSSYCHVNGVREQVMTVEGQNDDFTQTIQVSKAGVACYSVEVAQVGATQTMTWKAPGGGVIATGVNDGDTLKITCGGATHDITDLDCPGTFGEPDPDDCTAGTCP